MASNYSVIYSFGDSLSDAGDAYLLTTSALANNLRYYGVPLPPEPVSPPYYAETYGGSLTADVFSNGSVWVQNLDTALSLPVLSPGTVGITFATLQTIGTAEAVAAGVPSLLIGGFVSQLVSFAEAESIVNNGYTENNGYLTIANGAAGGTDFAIGGAVTGPTAQETSPLVALTDLTAQLTNFDNSVTAPAANALATVWIGSNDVLDVLENTSFSTLFPAFTTQANVGGTVAGQEVQQSVNNEINFIGSLVAQGLTNLLVLDVPDLGTIPEITDTYPSEVGAATILSADYNNLLNAALATIDLAGHVTIENTFSLIDTAVTNPTPYGLSDVTSPVYSGSLSNYASADLVSSDPAVQNTYLFFDQEHPTETGQAYVATGAEQALGIPCFASGTRIRTARGHVTVETLRLGDQVATVSDGWQPVIWIGRREVDCRQAEKPALVWPVRVRAGAFGPKTPLRELYLSPDHAVLVDGVLIPFKHLIDGEAIAQVACAAITYWHVELPRHAVLLAEGLACESFLDTGQRSDDGMIKPRRADYVSRVWEATGCAELVVAGPRLDAARASLRPAVARRSR